MNISIFAANFRKKVKKIFVLFLTLFLTHSAYSQIHEVGVFVGGSNFIGDVGKENFIAPNNLAFGGIYKWNKSTRHSWRFSIMRSILKMDDADSHSAARNERGFSLENSVTELSAGMEFNFFDFNLHELGFKITPYVHTGLSYFWYDGKYFLNEVAQNDGDRDRAMAIPMTVGVKFNVAQQLVIGFETGARYTFADDLDGSNPKNSKYKPYAFGNLNSKDWYVFTGFTLTYTFGKNPCYCPL